MSQQRFSLSEVFPILDRVLTAVCGKTVTTNLAKALPIADDGLTIPVSGTVATTSATPTSGGATPYSKIFAASNNATSVKASAGQVYSIEAFNLNAAPAYLKLYNKASAPDPATDTPVKRLMIPGNTAGAGFVIDFGKGIEFSTGIAFLVVTGIGDTNNSSVAANEGLINIDYK